MNTRDFIYIGFIVILIMFGLHQCSEAKYQSTINQNNLQASESLIKKYKDKLNREVAIKENYILNSSKDLKDLLNKNDSLKESLRNFKKVNSVTQIKTVTKIKEVILNRIDTIYNEKCDNFGVYNKMTKNYDIFVQVSDSVEVLDLSITNVQDVMIGDVRQGLFKKTSFDTKVVNSNPHITVTGLKTYSVEVPKKWYEKPYITIPIGIVGGLLIK